MRSVHLESALDKSLFIENLARVRKRKVLLLRLSLSLLFVILAASMWLSKAQVTDGFRHGYKTVSILVFGLVVYACVAAIARMTRRLGLHCPHCQRSLAGPLSHRAVASDTCFHCGMGLF